MKKIILVLIFILAASIFSGCVSENINNPLKDVSFDVKPAEITVKDSGSAELKIRVANPGKTNIHPYVRFNKNSSDSQYMDITPQSYDLGILRPGEDSGFRIVNVKARLAAGKEIKYQVRAQLVYDEKVIDSRDIVVTVTKD
jgi:hypothetical protein